MNINKKEFSNIISVVLIIIIAGVVGYFVSHKLLLQSILPTAEQSLTTQITPPDAKQMIPLTSPDSNTFSTDLNGYFYICDTNTSAIHKYVNNSWKKVTDLPRAGLYYLDNQFVGYGMCDSFVCTELPKPHIIQLVEYKKIGEKAPPSNSGSTANTLPMYQTISLNGDIKIEIQYFSDNNCQNKKTFSTIIKR